MPDPARPLARAIHGLLRRAGNEVLAVARNGRRVPSLSPRVSLWVDTLTPLVLPLAAKGGWRAIRGIRGQLRKRRRKSVALAPLALVNGRFKADAAADPIGFDLSLFNPRILEAIRRMVFDFAVSTLETSRHETQEAYSLLREELAEGLSKGEAVNRLAQRVRGIFDDPARAYLIARTESARAVVAGEIIAAKESQVVSKKEWLASPGACPACMALAGKVVGLDEPFVTLPGGGLYSVVTQPPYHPRCTCSLLYPVDV